MLAQCPVASRCSTHPWSPRTPLRWANCIGGCWRTLMEKSYGSSENKKTFKYVSTLITNAEVTHALLLWLDSTTNEFVKILDSTASYETPWTIPWKNKLVSVSLSSILWVFSGSSPLSPLKPRGSSEQLAAMQPGPASAQATPPCRWTTLHQSPGAPLRWGEYILQPRWPHKSCIMLYI